MMDDRDVIVDDDEDCDDIHHEGSRLSSSSAIRSTLRDVLATVAARAGEYSCRQWCGLGLLSGLLFMGNAMQIIGINFWLRAFRSNPSSSYITFLISNVAFGSFFVLLLIAYFARPSRPKQVWFACSRRAIATIFIIGFFDAFNSWLSIYATTNTPEVLQALFTSLSSIYCFIMSKFILKDPRDYVNRWALGSFALIITGVMIAAVAHLSSGGGDDGASPPPSASLLNASTAYFNASSSQHTTTEAAVATPQKSGSEAWWIVVFFLSVPAQSFYNVLQSKYMNDYTFDGTAAEYKELPPQAQRLKGTDTTVKVVMLFGDTSVQLLVAIAFLPMDAVSWWGSSASLTHTWANVYEGIDCVLSCPDNWHYLLLYTSGIVSTYIGSAYLNHYSATLCSMLSQLSSPVTALLLVLVPSLNLNPGNSPWYATLAAVVLLIVGTIMFGVWEEMTALDTASSDGGGARSDDRDEDMDFDDGDDGGEHVALQVR